MRISSKFKDYYDSGQVMGQDHGLIYVRYPKTIECDRGIPIYNLSVDRYTKPGMLVIRSKTIGFCGKLYPVYEVTPTTPGFTPLKHYCYTLDDVDKVANRYLKDKDLTTYYAKESKAGRFFRAADAGGFNGKRSSIECYMHRFNEKVAGNKDRIEDLFTKEKSPIFVVEDIAAPHGYVTGHKIHYNAMLRPYEFIRVFDPTQAFQEISMFLGNMAFPNKPIPELSNADKIVSKGFDQFSFRKPKQGA